MFSQTEIHACDFKYSVFSPFGTNPRVEIGLCWLADFFRFLLMSHYTSHAWHTSLKFQLLEFLYAKKEWYLRLNVIWILELSREGLCMDLICTWSVINAWALGCLYIMDKAYTCIPQCGNGIILFMGDQGRIIDIYLLVWTLLPFWTEAWII